MYNIDLHENIFRYYTIMYNIVNEIKEEMVELVKWLRG